VIDDNSRDATAEILRRFSDIHVIRHERNTHIPGGLLDGMRYAVECGYAYGIAMDAGLSHNPDEIPRFMQYGHADLVIGTREIKYHVPLFRQLLSATGGFIYNICLDFPRSVWKRQYFKDITSGYRRYSNRAMQLIISKQIRSRSFDILFETAMYIYRNDLTISEVPITYTFSNSSLNSNVVKDCLKMCFRALLDRKK
jgi:dolichol-phosphate mannosyltransferase